MLEPVNTSETSANFCETIQRNIPEGPFSIHSEIKKNLMNMQMNILEITKVSLQIPINQKTVSGCN
jgi:hypothetical protein